MTKEEFRKTKEWLDFRDDMKDIQKTDQLTLKPLRKGWNLHHCDPKNYEDLDPIKFECVNKTSHRIIHEIYRYYKRDPEILDRLKGILMKMSLYE